MSQETINGILGSLSIILTGVSVQLSNAGKAQRRALKELRELDIKKSIYIHKLRSKFAEETGKNPPEVSWK